MAPTWTEGSKRRGYLKRRITTTYLNRAIFSLLAACAGLLFFAAGVVTRIMKPEEGGVAVAVFGALFAIASLAFLVRSALHWRTPSGSPAWREIEECYGDPDATLTIIEDEMEVSGRLDVGFITFSKNWFIRRGDVGVIVCRLEDFRDIRHQVHHNKKVGVTLSTTHLLRIRAHDDREWEFMVPEAKLSPVLDHLSQRLPDVPIAETQTDGLVGAVLNELSGD